MRRILVLALVVGSVVLQAVPAQAVHYYAKLRSAGGSTSIETDCPAGRTLLVSVSGQPAYNAKVPTSRATSVGTRTLVSSNQSLADAVSSGGTVTATCNGHPLRVTLPMTGVTTQQQLLVGGGLLAVGVVLLLFGFSPPSSRGPRGPRPPVKVYAQ